MFVAGGFAAIRYAETVTIWQARRRARKAAKKAAAAEAEAYRRAAERDRRVDAYVGRIGPRFCVTSLASRTWKPRCGHTCSGNRHEAPGRRGALAVLAAAAGITGCGRSPLFASPSAAHKPKACTDQDRRRHSAVAVLVHRDSASSRAELNAILLTASPNEHFLLFKAATGKLVGSFTTPPGPVLPGPTPPPALPSDPTQVQTTRLQPRRRPLRQGTAARTGPLHLRWLARLATWASHVMSKATAPPVEGKGPT